LGEALAVGAAAVFGLIETWAADLQFGELEIQIGSEWSGLPFSSCSSGRQWPFAAWELADEAVGMDKLHVVVVVCRGHEHHDMAVGSVAVVEHIRQVVDRSLLAEGDGEPCLVAEDTSRSKKVAL
jgi:hypothetical protein